jgi:hypothetical protein
MMMMMMTATLDLVARRAPLAREAREQVMEMMMMVMTTLDLVARRAPLAREEIKETMTLDLVVQAAAMVILVQSQHLSPPQRRKVENVPMNPLQSQHLSPPQK